MKPQNIPITPKHVVALIVINAFIMLIAIVSALYYMYTVALNEESQRLRELAQSQARIIESVSQHDYQHHKQHQKSKLEAWEMTLSQIKNAHENYEGFGETGEFTLAIKDDDKIFFLLSHRHLDLERPKSVELFSDTAEPMQLALRDMSGTMIGFDYRKVKVLAAYEPVKT